MQLTAVVPSANVSPELAEQRGVTVPSTMSLALAENDTAAPDGPVASAVMSAGTVTTGAVVSPTATPKPPLPVLPAPSVAEHDTPDSPSENVLPDAGEQLTATEPSTMSLALAENDAAAPVGPVASTVMSAGTVTTGAVVSRTVTPKLPLPVLPC